MLKGIDQRRNRNCRATLANAPGGAAAVHQILTQHVFSHSSTAQSNVGGDQKSDSDGQNFALTISENQREGSLLKNGQNVFFSKD